jgi:hypothetical protein
VDAESAAVPFPLVAGPGALLSGIFAPAPAAPVCGGTSRRSVVDALAVFPAASVALRTAEFGLSPARAGAARLLPLGGESEPVTAAYPFFHFA